MTFDLSHVVTVVVGLLAGAVAGLKVIAPMTATKVDDEVLDRLEQLEQLVHSLHLDGSPADEPAPAVAPAPAAK